MSGALEENEWLAIYLRFAYGIDAFAEEEQMGEWMTRDFTSFSTVLKGCVQWNPVYG